jgi:hypothetical protein
MSSAAGAAIKHPDTISITQLRNYPKEYTKPSGMVYKASIAYDRVLVAVAIFRDK